MASLGWAKRTARRDEKQLKFGFGATYTRCLTVRPNRRCSDDRPHDRLASISIKRCQLYLMVVVQVGWGCVFFVEIVRVLFGRCFTRIVLQLTQICIVSRQTVDKPSFAQLTNRFTTPYVVNKSKSVNCIITFTYLSNVNYNPKNNYLNPRMQRGNQCIRAKTKWPPFCRRHFQIHFPVWKYLNFDPNFTQLC